MTGVHYLLSLSHCITYLTLESIFKLKMPSKVRAFEFCGSTSESESLMRHYWHSLTFFYISFQDASESIVTLAKSVAEQQYFIQNMSCEDFLQVIKSSQSTRNNTRRRGTSGATLPFSTEAFPEDFMCKAIPWCTPCKQSKRASGRDSKDLDACAFESGCPLSLLSSNCKLETCYRSAGYFEGRPSYLQSFC